MTKKLILSLIGAPGSGKGSYGRYLAKALGCSLIGMSDVLREMRPDLDLSSGKLVDDTVVESSLNQFLSRHDKDPSKGFLLDGYPRTVGQLDGNVSIDAAILLAVPDFVCESKLLGRRLCLKCDGNFNVNDVDMEGWRLPPTLPTKSGCSEENCDWETRSDDDVAIIHSRLRLFHAHADPIASYFEKRQRLLKLQPFTGFQEVAKMTEEAEMFLKRI